MTARPLTRRQRLGNTITLTISAGILFALGHGIFDAAVAL